MALGNTKMQAILKEYDDLRRENHHILVKRREEVAQKAPAYFEYHNQIISLCMQHASVSLYPEDDAVPSVSSGKAAIDKLQSSYHKRLEQLRAAKKQTLEQAGFPADYLEPIYRCPICQDTGFVQTAQCQCLRKRIIRALYSQSGIEHQLETNNFNTLSYDYYTGADLDAFRNAVQISHAMIEAFPTHKDNLLFTGTVGCGKSFLSGCIAKELMDRGFSVVYFSAAQLFDILYQNGLYNEQEDLYNYELVIVDDLGSEITNSVVTAALFSFLNERLLRQRATIISTNLGLSEIKERYSERIASRVIQNYKICKMSGPDIRILQKRLLSRK